MWCHGLDAFTWNYPEMDNDNVGIQTPIRTRQFRDSKRRARASFDVNRILKKVEENERCKILVSSASKADKYMHTLNICIHSGMQQLIT